MNYADEKSSGPPVQRTKTGVPPPSGRPSVSTAAPASATPAASGPDLLGLGPGPAGPVRSGPAPTIDELMAPQPKVVPVAELPGLLGAGSQAQQAVPVRELPVARGPRPR
jgi:hypothetical protein